jgi:hypothetical protein
MGDRGETCGVPVDTEIKVSTLPEKIREILRADRKERIQSFK